MGHKIAIDFESVAWPILMRCDVVNTATLACLFAHSCLGDMHYGS